MDLETLINFSTVELIIFIAFKACGGRDFFYKKNPFQYINATILIAFAIEIHILQIIMLTTDYISFPLQKINSEMYVAIIFSFIVISYLSKLLFPKKILAKSLKKYNGGNIGRYAKLIAFGYLFLNIAISILIAI